MCIKSKPISNELLLNHCNDKAYHPSFKMTSSVGTAVFEDVTIKCFSGELGEPEHSRTSSTEYLLRSPVDRTEWSGMSRFLEEGKTNDTGSPGAPSKCNLQSEVREMQ